MTKEGRLNITEAMLENVDKIAAKIIGSHFVWISGRYDDDGSLSVNIVTQGTTPNPINWDWEKEWLIKVRQWQYLDDIDLEDMSEEEKQETLEFFVEKSIPEWAERVELKEVQK